MIKDDLQQMVVIHEDTHSHFAPLDTLQPVVVSDTNTTHSRIASIKRRTEEENDDGWWWLRCNGDVDRNGDADADVVDGFDLDDAWWGVMTMAMAMRWVF